MMDKGGLDPVTYASISALLVGVSMLAQRTSQRETRRGSIR